LYINVLNYRYFHTDCPTFLNIKNIGKIKKNVETRFYRKIKKFVNVYYNYMHIAFDAGYKPQSDRAQRNISAGTAA